MSSTETKAESEAQEIAAKIKEELIPIYIMGRKYDVPKGLTIMKAMEYAGYKFIRGCGCRGGICGACSTVYRMPGDYHIRTALACQTEAQPEMYLTQIPFYPANRSSYKWDELKGTPDEVFQLYPEVFRCVACNACTKACPMEIEVMDAVAALKRGDIAQAAQLTFDCIQCGLCASRCMGELPQYHLFQLARRIHGAKIIPSAEHLRQAMESIKEGKYDEMLQKLMGMGEEELKRLYVERDWEPETAGEDWRPTKERDFLLEVED